ncbi:MAG: hypothetical protein R6V60_00440 [Desulfobacterales bacterium]
MLIIENYLVFYVVKVGAIQIRRIIHGARRYGFLVCGIFRETEGK